MEIVEAHKEDKENKAKVFRTIFQLGKCKFTPQWDATKPYTRIANIKKAEQIKVEMGQVWVHSYLNTLEMCKFQRFNKVKK